MTKLDIQSGNLTVGGLTLNARTNEKDIVKVFDDERLSYTVRTEALVSIFISDVDDGNVSLFLSFEHDKLRKIFLSVGSSFCKEPFVISVEEVQYQLNLLKSLGGENSYPWGEVGFLEDERVGEVIIVIKYRK